MAITHDVLDLTFQGSPPDMRAHFTRNSPRYGPTPGHGTLALPPLSTFKLFHYKAQTVGKREVHILLESFLTK